LDFEALVRRCYKQDVSPARIVTLKGDASSRRYHRLFMPDGLQPNRLIVMELPEDALRSDEAVGGDTPEELPFLNVARHFKEAGLRVPEIHLDAVAEGAVLLEDLGDELLVGVIRNKEEDTLRDWYAAAVDLMADMHERMWPIPDSCIASRRNFDYALLRWELDHYREWGLEARQDITLSPDRRARLDRAFDELAREIDRLPKGFVHRDYQSRNLMVLQKKPSPASLAIIDFQDAFIGPRIYDLAALLNDSYVALPFRLKEEIIARYANKRNLDFDTLRQEFHLVTVQRKLKDGGRFVFIDRVKHNPAFLAFVDASFERVKDALAALPGHEPLKEILAEAAPEHFATN